MQENPFPNNLPKTAPLPCPVLVLLPTPFTAGWEVIFPCRVYTGERNDL